MSGVGRTYQKSISNDRRVAHLVVSNFHHAARIGLNLRAGQYVELDKLAARNGEVQRLLRWSMGFPKAHVMKVANALLMLETSMDGKDVNVWHMFEGFFFDYVVHCVACVSKHDPVWSKVVQFLAQCSSGTPFQNTILLGSVLNFQGTLPWDLMTNIEPEKDGFQKDASFLPIWKEHRMKILEYIAPTVMVDSVSAMLGGYIATWPKYFMFLELLPATCCWKGMICLRTFF